MLLVLRLFLSLFLIWKQQHQLQLQPQPFMPHCVVAGMAAVSGAVSIAPFIATVTAGLVLRLFSLMLLLLLSLIGSASAAAFAPHEVASATTCSSPCLLLLHVWEFRH